MSDILDSEILELLSSASEPVTASFVGFSLSDYSFAEVCEALERLQLQELIKLDYLGYHILPNGAEVLDRRLDLEKDEAWHGVPLNEAYIGDGLPLTQEESLQAGEVGEECQRIEASDGDLRESNPMAAHDKTSRTGEGTVGASGLIEESAPTDLIGSKEDRREEMEGRYQSEEYIGAPARQTEVLSQEQKEYEEMLAMLMGSDETREGNDAEVVADNAQTEEHHKVYCDTSMSELGFGPSLVTFLHRNGISVLKDLVGVYDSITMTPGIYRRDVEDIRDTLHAHAREMPGSASGESLAALSGVSNSRQFVFDMFGQLRCLESEETAPSSHRDGIPVGAYQEESTSAFVSESTIGSDTPITVLGLPTRLTKALLREGYGTVELAAGLSDEELLAMRGVGLLAVEDFRAALKKGLGHEPTSPTVIRDPDGQTPITSLGLPNRLTNALIREGYDTVELAAELTDDDILAMRGLGLTSVRDFRSAMRQRSSGERTQHLAESHGQDVATSLNEDAVAGVLQAERMLDSRGYPIYKDSFLAYMPYVVIDRLGEGCSIQEYCDLAVELAEESDDLIEACERALVRGIEDKRKLETPTDLATPLMFPDYPEWREAARRVSDDDRWCEPVDGFPALEILHPTLTEWLVASDLSERNVELIRMYLSGQTLEACGKEYELTRERVRQITSKALKEAPFLAENRYRHLFESYNLSKSVFLAITKEPISTYVYLRTTKSKDRHRDSALPIAAALSDGAVPEGVKDRIRRLMDKDYVYVDGNRILKRKDVIINHLVTTHASRRYITSTNLSRLYKQFLIDNDLSGLKGLTFSNMHAFEAYVDRCDQVMKLPHAADRAYGGSIRSYDAQSMDFTLLERALSLFPVGEVECSTAALMRCEELSDVLEELDIRNELELHYVLSRYCQPIEGVKLGRCPNVTFGEGSRNEQILELIKELSPVSTNELSAAYSERYGVEAGTFAGSYLNSFKIYRRNGKYTFTEERLTKEQGSFLLSQLNSAGRDYFSISLLKARFKARFPEASTSLVSAANIAHMGFHPSEGLLIRDGIDDRVLFASLIDSMRRFSVDDPDFGSAVFDNGNFQAELAIRVRAYEVVEYEKGRYLSTSIFGSTDPSVSSADLKDYVDSAIAFMEPGRPYTVQSLLNLGFRHKVDFLRDEFGLSRYFFSSLLSTGYVGGRLKGTSIGSVPVFCRTPYSYSAPMMVEWLVEREEALEVDDLSCLLKDEYGVEANNALLRTIIARTDLYFSESLDMVFESEETYKRKAIEWIS